MIKKSPKLFFFTIIFIVLILTPVVLNIFYNWQLQAVAKQATAEAEKIFIITPGQPVIQIAENLKEENLIKNPLAFRLLVAQMGISRTIQAGDFRLSAAMSSRDIAQHLTHGAIDIWITIPEGLRIEEQAERIEAKLKTSNDKFQFDKKEYIKLAEEGYMFPDTYLIPKDVTAGDMAAKLRETFDEKIDANLLAGGATNDLTVQEVVVLASLIEKEAKTDEEKGIIGGILTNRLNAGMPLQVDATVSYAKGYDTAKNTWWSPPTIEEYKTVRSPFNTYLRVGLPTAPIASPGIEAIRAAAEPKDTPFFYYLHDQEGTIHYAKTIEEHNNNVREFL